MAPELEDRLGKLDELLEKYLGLVDEYEHSRKILSTSMSSGFFSLAQANRVSTINRRYGPDFYDYRMQSLRKVVVEDVGENSIPRFTITSSTTKQKPENISSNIIDDKDSAADSETQRSSDPIHWFGVLIPQPLRDAQTQFSSVIDVSISRILNLTGEMRLLEIEIARARKAIKKAEKSVDSTISSAVSAT